MSDTDTILRFLAGAPGSGLALACFDAGEVLRWLVGNVEGAERC